MFLEFFENIENRRNDMDLCERSQAKNGFRDIGEFPQTESSSNFSYELHCK